VERGYNQTTVDDIVAELQVSTRTFFRYFDSKEAVVVAGPFAPGARLVEFASSAPADLSALGAARHAVWRLAEYRETFTDGLNHAILMVETPELAGRLAREREIWSHELARAIEPRVDGGDAVLLAGVIAATTIWTLATAFECWAAERGARRLTAVLEKAFALADEAHAGGERIEGVA
jgi:AcrR family transcriptional regulator